MTTTEERPVLGVDDEQAGLAQTCRDVSLTPPMPALPAVVEQGPRVLSRQEATDPLDHVVEGARYLVNPEYLQTGETCAVTCGRARASWRRCALTAWSRTSTST